MFLSLYPNILSVSLYFLFIFSLIFSLVKRRKKKDEKDEAVVSVRGFSKKSLKEKFILTAEPVDVEEIGKTGRKSPADPKPAVKKRRRSSSSNLNNSNLDATNHQPAAKKPKPVRGKILCTQCDREFDECEFRRHNKINHNLQCSHEDCPLVFVDVPNLSHHLRSHQDLEKPRPQTPGKNLKAPDENFVAAPVTRRSERMKLSSVRPKVAKKEEAVIPSAIARRSGRRKSFSVRDDPPPPPSQAPKKSEQISPISRSKNSSDELWTPQSAKKKRREKRSPVKKEKVAASSPPAGRKRSLSGLSLLEVREYWRCFHCQEVFPSQAKLETHQQKDHKHPCAVEPGCLRSFIQISDRLKHHYEAHNHKRQLVQCPICLEMVDSKSRKTHDQRSHDLSCTEEGCPVKSNAEGIWSHRIKKHNYGSCANQQEAGPVEDSLTLSDVATEEEEDEEGRDLSLIPEAPIDVDSSEESEARVDVMEEHEESDLEKEEDDGEACGPEKKKKENENEENISLVPGEEQGDVPVDGKSLYEQFESLVEMFPQSEQQPSFQRCGECGVLVEDRKFLHHGKKNHRFPCGEPGCSLQFTRMKDKYQHRLAVHDTRQDVELAGYQVCPDCWELFSEKEQQQFSLHLKLRDHLTCSKCQLKLGRHNKDLFQFHVQSEHCESTDLACPHCDLQFCQTDSVRHVKHSEQAHSFGPCPHCPSDKALTFLTEERFHQHKDNCQKLPILSLEDNLESVEGPEDDNEYHAEDEEKEEEERRDLGGNNWSWNHFKKRKEKQSIRKKIKGEPLKTVVNEERNPIIVSVDDEKAVEEEGKSKSEATEYFDDIDALLGNSSDEENEDGAKENSSFTGQSVTVVDTAPVFPVVVLETSRKNFKCSQCRQDFKMKEKEFIAHMKSRHSFKCQYCPLKFTFMNGLNDHVNREHHHEVNVRCQLCQVSFKRESALLTHLKKDHDHPCPECQLKFTGEVFLAEHLLQGHHIKPSQDQTSGRRSGEKSKKRKKNDLSSDSVRSSSRYKTSKREKLQSQSKSKSSRVAKVLVKNSLEDEDSNVPMSCAQCHQHFQGTDAFEEHINLDHSHPCQDKKCELSFTTEYFQQLHQFEAHSMGTKPSSIYNNDEEPSLQELDCSTCGRSFQTFQEKANHDKLHYTPEKLVSQVFPVNKKSGRSRADRKPRFDCWNCRKTFNSKEERSQHKAEGHMFCCEHPGCPRSYISQSELDRHTTKRHQGVAKPEVKGFSCSDCGKNHQDLKSLNVHQLKPHGFTCHVFGCTRKFEAKPKLIQHLEGQHGIRHVKIDEQNSGYITTERSQDNVQISEWALDWIK